MLCAGVSDNRLQNIVITLDKIKLCLHKSGNTCKPPLRLLSDEEVIDYLWTGAQCLFIQLQHIDCMACRNKEHDGTLKAHALLCGREQVHRAAIPEGRDAAAV